MSTNKIKFAYVKYSTGEKEIVSIDRIKGFNIKSINYEKKYKIFWNEAYYEGIIIFVAESEEALEKKIGRNRLRLRPMNQYLSASESDIGYKRLEKDNNVENEDNNEKEELLAKKLKNLSSFKHSKSNNKEVEKLKEEIERLRKRIVELKRFLQDKDVIIEDYLKNNSTLQENMMEEIKELKSIIIERYKEKNNRKEEETEIFPVGYRREINNNVQIHIGRNIWISSQVYDSAVCISKSASSFTKNMALAIFGAQILQESSVTGTISNRIKNKNNTPRPRLDSQRLLALKDIVRYWLLNVKKYDEIAIDFEVNLVGKHVSQKIYELNRKNKHTVSESTKKKQESAGKSTVEVSIDENTDANAAVVNNDAMNSSNVENEDEEEI